MRFVFLSHVDVNLYLFRLPIMRSLVEAGHEVIALCPCGEFFDRFADAGIRAEEYFLCRKSRNPLQELRSLTSLYARLRELRPDVLHTFTIRPNLYGALTGKLVGVPRIFGAVTGLGSFYVEQTPKARTIRWMLNFAQCRAFRVMEKVVFQNRDDLLAYAAWGVVRGRKANLIRSSGVDTQIFRPDAVDKKRLAGLRKDLRIEPGQLVVLMVARAIWHKGLAEYIDASALLRQRFPQVVFLLAGDMDEGNPSSASRKYLLAQQAVRWLGHRDDIPALTALADICVLPSYREGVPRTLLEAAAAGKPIVATDVAGCREVVDHSVNGLLVPVCNAGALADAIGRLVVAPSLREEMGVQSRKKAVDEFDVQHVVRQYLELYKVNE